MDKEIMIFRVKTDLDLQKQNNRTG
jgi:hypothetical protein